MEHQYPIILFDGECNLCNGSVRFLYPRDSQGKLRFANLQSETGQALLTKFSVPTGGFDSFVLVEGESAYTHSTGALRTLRHLRFPWPIIGSGLSILPLVLRDLVYNWIARNRYAWFGKTDTCQVPTQKLQARFLH